MLAELASRGLRGVAFDLPGLGLAERPSGFDYTWTGLGRFCAAAVDELDLDRFHLVVHDIGGPVGLRLAAARRDRISSLTILNTMIDVDTFKRPWAMEPFARRGIGEIYLRTLSKPAFRLLMLRLGVADMSSVSVSELDAYVDLLKREDGGRASEDHARLRAHAAKAGAVSLHRARRPVAGAGRLGRARPGPEDRPRG
ncbi:MAG: alpha/beta fold hydrolase [Actinomycetota bacterium]|nr:alpha/beta fold hydrolase [Actinomycetota bacterium]